MPVMPRARSGNSEGPHDISAEGGAIASPSGISSATDSPCQSCGACCAYSRTWPRFSLESDEALQLIPVKYVAADGSGMGCSGDRCLALQGEVGKATACAIYAIRPDVCRACQPGDQECNAARLRHGLDVLGVVPASTGKT